MWKYFRILLLPLSITVLVIISLGVGGFLYILYDSACEKQIVEQIPSPDKRHKITYFIEDCGATSDFYTRVFLENWWSDIDIFTIKGEHKDIPIHWADDNNVLIHERFYKDDSARPKLQWDGIRVHFVD